MSDRSELAELFLSSNGRLARTPFLIAAAILLGVAVLYEAIAGYTLHWLTGWVVYPALLFSGACVLSKRLHDRGRSGWWALLILVAVFGATISYVLMMAAHITLRIRRPKMERPYRTPGGIFTSGVALVLVTGRRRLPIC